MGAGALEEDVSPSDSQGSPLVSHPPPPPPSKTLSLWLPLPNFQLLLEGLEVKEVNRPARQSRQGNYRV